MTSLGASCVASGCGTRRLVRYTATGIEGTDFFVPIGATLAATTFSVGLFGTEGCVNEPICDFPVLPSTNRTTTTFRVVTAAVMAVGDILVFEIVE